MNIALTGFMASGKTKISKHLSKQLGYNLIDTDNLIVSEMNMSINDIFEKFGEKKFREIEHKIISQCAGYKNTVISTGGGVPLNPENMISLRTHAVIVNLAPKFEVISERLSRARGSRPLLKDSSISDIEKRFNDRLPYYADCDLKIEVSNEFGPEYFAEKICDNIAKLIFDSKTCAEWQKNIDKEFIEIIIDYKINE